MTKFLLEPYFSNEERLVAERSNCLTIDTQYIWDATWRQRAWFASNFGPGDLHRGGQGPSFPCNPIASTKV